MEDSGDDDNGSIGGDMSDGVGSSDPPSFAVPPGGMPDDTRSSDDGMISDSRSVTPTPPAASAPVPAAVATDDPFDFLSMTAPPSNNNENTAVISGADVFDVFASDNNNNNDLLGSTIPSSSQIDMDVQQSMIGGTAVQTSGVVPASPRELQTAESGDLLGLGGDSPRNQPPPDDLMDSNFQTMPVSVPVSTAIDPFDMNNNNNNVFQQSAVAAPGNIAANGLENYTNVSVVPPQKQQPEQQSSSQQQPMPASTSDSIVVDNDEIQPNKDAQNPVTSVQDQATSSNSVADASSVEAPKETATKQEAPSPPEVSTPNPSSSDTTKSDTTETAVDAPATTPNDDDVVPDSPSPSGEDDMLEEPLEEVELVSPQQSASIQEDGDNNKIAQQKEAALQIKSLKPPLTEEENSASQAVNNKEQEKKLQDLQEQLSKAQQQIEKLQKQKDQIEHQHNDSQRETANVLQELQNKLLEEVSKRGEAENDATMAKEEIQNLQTSLQKKEEEWKEQTDDWKQQLSVLEKENEDLVTKARQELEDRKEHERRERVLANKLNMLKKAQTTKTDVEEVYEDDLRLLKEEVDTKTKRIEELELSEASLKEQLEKEKAVSETRIEKLEKTVREEKALNEERKKKMKAFIESKVDELKEAKAESEHYQNELNSTNTSMIDMNNRWKTLHAQWVQSQTRNRELQRDLNKIKNDSENLHKVGDSLNVKLSKSANEMEQHKSKRLAAKQELMSVLGQLEAEREITNKLRDSVRFTFTPKAQSQHQLLQENLSELDKQLEALARRLGRPIPLSNDMNNNSLSSLVMSAVEESERSEHDDGTAQINGNQDGKGPTKEQKRILMETTRLLGKLENETQRISQGIMALSSAIEQMNQLIVGGGEKTCFTSLGGIFFGGGLAKALESDRSRNGAAGNRAAPVRYGHSSHFPSESGTMTWYKYKH